MVNKFQLKHPAGKKAVCMDREKYAILKQGIIDCLNLKEEATQKEILISITRNIKKNKVKFQGSVEWHMEWVKLDLEARKQIKRIDDVSPIKYVIY